jgi:hypothetical protein
MPEPLVKSALQGAGVEDTSSRSGRVGFQQVVAASIASQLGATAAELSAIPAELRALSRRFVLLDRRLRTAAQCDAELRELPAADDLAAAEYERLLAMPGIRELDTRAGSVILRTESIVVQSQGTSYQLGEYAIVLDLRGDVRVESLSRLGPKSHWDHPHIQNALPCLGNLRAGVLKLIAQYQLALVAQVLLEFLATYDPAEAYTPIEGWPKAP